MKAKKLIIGSMLLASTLLSCGEKKELKTAREFILTQTPNYQTVMFGENHLSEEDNDYAEKFLPELKKQGFDYFAIEISREDKLPKLHPYIEIMMDEYNKGEINTEELGEKIMDLTREGKQDLTVHLKGLLKKYAEGKIKRKEISKFWNITLKSSCPGWLDTMDKARKVGMKIVCYDAKEETYQSFNQRESIAMGNIEKLIFDKDPDAKVVFYAGGAHLSEKLTRSQNLLEYERFMLNHYGEGLYYTIGARLTEHTEGKNLTIDLSGTTWASEINFTDYRINLSDGKIKMNIAHRETIR